MADREGIEPSSTGLEAVVLPLHYRSIIHFQQTFAVRATLVEGSAADVTYFYQRGRLKMDPSRVAYTASRWIKHIHPFLALGSLKSTRLVLSGPALFVDRES